jgi:hypothetical protein
VQGCFGHGPFLFLEAREGLSIGGHRRAVECGRREEGRELRGL